MSEIRRERRPGGIELLRLHRPAQRNAMGSAMLAELNGALAELAADETLRVLVFSSTDPRALCAGADVSEQLDHDAGVARMAAFGELYARVAGFPRPTVAVCTGNVVGAGAELAAACDLRVGGENLKLLFPGAKLGVPVGPARLTPLVGLARAKEWIMTAKVVGIDEAERAGFVCARAPEADAEAVALTLAERLCEQSADGLAQLKGLFSENEDLAARTAAENERIVAFQRDGGTLPYRGARE